MENISDFGHWQIDLVGEFDPADWVGFIYRIAHKGTGRAYIGKKSFSFKKTRQKNKKKRSIRVESDWKDYCSSCDPLKTDIETLGKDAFEFQILVLCSGKSELTYLEEAIQYGCDILHATLPDGTKAYYNRTIGYKHFAGVEKQSLQSRQKTSEALRLYHEKNPGANVSTAATRQKISDTLKAFNDRLTSEERSASRLQNISPEERSALASHARQSLPHDVLVRGGVTAGNILKQEGRGVCGLSAEDRKKYSSMGGSIVGKLKWWTNGTDTIRASEAPSSEWKQGRKI